MDSASEDEFRTPRKVKPEAESAPEITPEKAAEIGKEQQATDRCKTGNDSFAVALYESCKTKWKEVLPMLQAGISGADVGENGKVWVGKSWLRSKSSEAGFRVGCAACASQLKERGSTTSNPFASYTVELKKGCALNVLKKHQSSSVHQQNVRALLALELGPSGLSMAGAPPAEAFIKLWDKVVTGSCSDGVAGVGSHSKCERMAKVLGEAMLDIERAKLRGCTVIGLQRDEADGRMWFRYRAVTPDLALIQGVMGHVRKEFKGAKGVLMATDKVFENFCTPGRVMNKDGAKMDRRLYSHVRRRLEMVNVDSDGKELLAASMMREQTFPDNHGVEELVGKPLAPNMRLTLRDKTHASRRRR